MIDKESFQFSERREAMDNFESLCNSKFITSNIGFKLLSAHEPVVCMHRPFYTQHVHRSLILTTIVNVAYLLGKDVKKSLLSSNAETLEDKQLSQDVFELKRNESLHDIGGGAPVPNIKKRKRNLRPRQMPSDSSSSSTLSGSVPNLPDTIGKEDFYDAYGSLHEFKDDKVTTILAQDIDRELKEISSEQTAQSQRPSATPRQPLNTSGKSPTSK